MPSPISLNSRGLYFALQGAVVLLCATACAADEFVEIVIPLKDGSKYSVRQFCEEANRKLGTHCPVESIPDRDVELSVVERAALLLANETGLVRARIEPDRLILAVPNPEDDRTRRRIRQRLERLLGIPLDQWPTGKGLHLPDHFDPRVRTIILVHGLESHTAELQRFADACSHWGIQPVLFDYPNDGPLAWSGDRLSNELKALAQKFPELRIAIVAHSMGGLVSRYCLETPGKNPGCVTDLFMLGTPNHGTVLSDIQPWMELVYESLSNQVERWGTLRDGLGEAADDLRPQSAFLKTLNSRARPRGTTYHVSAGSKSLVSEPLRKAAEEQLGQLADRNALSQTIRDRARLIVQAPELQDGRGDGAVTIDSALLEGVADRKTFNLSHLDLLSLPGNPPEDAELFRWIVNSLNWPRQSKVSR